MKLNEKCVIYGTRVILVPYEKEHVEKYHNWMQNKDILAATASGFWFFTFKRFFYFEIPIIRVTEIQSIFN